MKNKREKVISLLKERLEAPSHDEAIEKAVGKAVDSMHKKYVQEVHIPKEVVMKGLAKEIQEALDDALEKRVEMKADITNDLLNVKTEGTTKVKGTVEVGNDIKGNVKISNPEDIKQPDNSGAIVSFLSAAFQQLIDFFGRLQQRTYNVQPTQEAFETPQRAVLVDPDTMQPISLGEEMGGVIGDVVATGGTASAPSKVGIRGSNKIGTGTTTVSTAGTRVQLPTQTIDRVYVQAHPDNTGEVVIGGKDVVAASANREGLALYGSQWQPFTPKNLNSLWVDATENGDKINYIYEYDD